jgi:hypothetical protein
MNSLYNAYRANTSKYQAQGYMMGAATKMGDSYVEDLMNRIGVNRLELL